MRWVDNAAEANIAIEPAQHRIDWIRVIPFLLIHLGCLAVIQVGWSPTAVTVAVVLYLLRMLAITGFYHRYFSHRAFRTSRGAQFVFAVLGASAAQRGPLWWASHHRHHHANSDRPADAHSPGQHGFLWSHLGWFMSPHNFATRTGAVSDLARYPELRFLDRFDVLVPAGLIALLFLMGTGFEHLAPELQTSGPQLVVWGFFVSTVVLYHATFTVNSLAHCYGRRRYATSDDSRNNFMLALLTLGEGWHNNHHHFPGSARQGFYWWELDITFYFLRVLASLGVIWDLRPVPADIRAARRIEGAVGSTQ